jgi:hypothetical protein
LRGGRFFGAFGDEVNREFDARPDDSPEDWGTNEVDRRLELLGFTREQIGKTIERSMRGN